MVNSISDEQKEIIETCDAVVWEVGAENTKMNFFKNKNNVKPLEIGFTYHIVLYKVSPEEYTDSFSAVIGDPLSYVNRISDIGYSGIMVKKGSVSNAKVKKLFKDTLGKIGIKDKVINKLCDQLK